MTSSHIVSPALLLAPDAIPDQSPDETVASFSCATCSKVGREEYPDASSYVDAQDKPMRDAQMSPGHGWACSLACLSQLMFRVATPEQKARLKRFELALIALEETTQYLTEMFQEWGMEIDPRSLIRAVEFAHVGIGFDDRHRENPAWITDNEEPAEELKRAVRQEANLLEWKAINDLKVKIAVELGRIDNPDYEHKKANPYATYSAAAMAASIGNVILRLKEVIA